MEKLKVALSILMLVLLNSFAIPMHTYAVTSYSFTNTTVEFEVYPNRTVGLTLNYFYNYTSPYLYYTGPARIHLEVETSKEDELTTINTNETVTFPEEQASQFPFNSTMISITQEFSQEILNAEINASTTFPNEWGGYLPGSSGYTYIDFNSFPFNSTDLTISGQYTEGAYNGTLYIHLIPGLTLGDIEIHMEGNTTHAIVSDHITIFYNHTLPIRELQPLNRKIIQEISQNKTYIDQMLYQMTGGLITCEVYNVTLVQIDDNSDIIYIEIVLKGDFTDVLAKIYQGIIRQTLYRSYYFYPSQLITGISRDLANITIQCVKNGSFEITYTRSARKAEIRADLSANLEEMWNMTQRIIDHLPPETQPYIKKFLEMKYATAKSYTETLTYQNGQITHIGSYTFEGDISGELNLIKDLYISLMVKTTPYPPPWQVDFVNKTRIIDMSNFKFYFDEQFEQNTQLVTLSFEGLKIAPPIDPINATHFKLVRLFNLTYSPYTEPPRSNEILRVIVKGGSNGTHIVIPIIDPEKVPRPDNIISGNTFIWENQSLSKLRELIFKVYSGFAQYVSKDYVSPNNPYIINARNIINCEVVINELEKDAVIIVENITLPENVNPPPGAYKLIGSYVNIKTETEEEISGNFTVKMFYNPEKLAELGIDEKSLKIHYWNTNKSEWIPVETYLNTEEHYAMANVDHLSIWALMGHVGKPIWTEIWFIVTASCLIIAVLSAIAFHLTRKRKKIVEIQSPT